MELRHLVSFVALAEELHFGRAAQRLTLSQPSLSAQVQKLEKSLGVALVIRNTHGVQLTAAGQGFARNAEDILRRVDRAADDARRTAAGRSGTVNVSYNFPASRHVLPSALSRMNTAHPDILVSLAERRTGPQLEGLADGSIDVALAYGPPTAGRFESRKIMSRLPVVAVVGRSHPWAGRRSVGCAELGDENIVLFARTQCPPMYDAVIAAARAAETTLTIVQNSDDAMGTAHMVAVKPFVAFASLTRAAAVGMGTVGSSTVAVKLVDPIPTVDLYVIWRAGVADPIVDAFVECVLDSVAMDDSDVLIVSQ